MKHGLMPLTASAFARFSTSDASGGQPPADPKPDDATGGDKDEKKFSQSELGAILKDRLAQMNRVAEREKAEAAKAAEEAAKAEAAKKLADEKQWEQLVTVKQTEVEALAAKVKSYESDAARLARFEAVLTERRDAEFGKLPEEVTELLKGKDIAEQIEWLNKYGSKFTRTEDEPPADGGKPGGGTPRPKKGKPADGGGALTVEEIARRKRASGDYQ